MEAGADEAVLQAVNVWRYDDDPAAVVNETVTIRASQERRDAEEPGAARSMSMSGSRRWSTAWRLPAARKSTTAATAE